MQLTPRMRAYWCVGLLMVAGAQPAHAQVFRSGIGMVGLTVAVTDAGLLGHL